MTCLIRKLANRVRISENLTRELMFTVIVQILIMIVNLLVYKAASNLMSVDSFGLFNVARRSANLVAFVLLNGLGISIPRFISIYRQTGKSSSEKNLLVAGISLALFTSLFLLFSSVIFPKFLSRLLLGSESLTSSVLPVSLNSIGILVFTFVSAFIRGINKIKTFNLMQLGFQIIVLSLIFLISKNPIVLLCWWGLIWIIISTVVFLLIYYSEPIASIPVNMELFKKEIKILLRYGLPRVAGEFALFGFFSIPLLILSSRNDLKTAAMFSVSIAFFQLFTAIFSFAGYVLLPYVSIGFSKGKMSEIVLNLRNLELLYLVGSLVSTFILIILTKFLIQLFFSPSFFDAIPATQIISFAILPFSFYLLYRNPIDAVSIFPWNTLFLFSAFILVVLLSVFASDIKGFAFAFVIASYILGISSLVAWKMLSKKLLIRNPSV